MNWITENIELIGNLIIVKPLDVNDFDELINSSQDEIIWKFLPTNGTDKNLLRKELELALVEKEKGNQYPFIVIEKATNKIIGCTRFIKMNQVYLNLEIGWTWFLPPYWGKGYNDECKLLLLTYCFENLKTIRVQIVANVFNLPSRNAIERIGGKFEGILRKKVLRADGPRTLAYYSIIDEEWDQVKTNLTSLIKSKHL